MTPWGTRRPSRVPAAAAVACAVVLAGACTGAAAEPGPADVVADYVEAYNADDTDALTEVFAADAVVIGHPYGPPRAEGIDIILRTHAADRSNASADAPMAISNVEVSDDTVTWDEVWTGDEGERFCAEGHSAVVEDGKIASWDYVPAEPCPGE